MQQNGKNRSKERKEDRKEIPLLKGSSQDWMAIKEVLEKTLSCELSALCLSKLLTRDGAGCQGDTPPSSRTMALTKQPIHSCDVSSTTNTDVGVLWAELVCVGLCISWWEELHLKNRCVIFLPQQRSWSGSTGYLKHIHYDYNRVHCLAC